MEVEEEEERKGGRQDGRAAAKEIGTEDAKVEDNHVDSENGDDEDETQEERDVGGGSLRGSYLYSL